MMVKWIQYFQDLQKQLALGCKISMPSIEYGDIIYQSAEFMGRRWLVTNFRGEFDVFVENIIGPDRYERLFAAAFTSKDRAVGFAVEMFLVCCGRLRRSNRHNLAKIPE
jgi:hypothetical protein